MNESRHSGSYQTTTKYTQRCRNESRIPGRETADSLLRYQCHRFAPVMLTADQSATIINSDSIASAIMVAYELVFFHWSAFRVRNKLAFINILGVLRLENFSRGGGSLFPFYPRPSLQHVVIIGTLERQPSQFLFQFFHLKLNWSVCATAICCFLFHVYRFSWQLVETVN